MPLEGPPTIQARSPPKWRSQSEWRASNTRISNSRKTIKLRLCLRNGARPVAAANRTRCRRTIVTIAEEAQKAQEQEEEETPQRQ